MPRQLTFTDFEYSARRRTTKQDVAGRCHRGKLRQGPKSMVPEADVRGAQ